MIERSVFAIGAGAVAFVALAIAWTGPARADSCDRLWYERNSIYADAGYCFKTPRARAVFGRGCVPPYGQLSPREQRRVSAIQAEEADLGCSD